MIMAKSLAGHDKDKIYLVIEETESSVTLVNGTTKRLGSPKIKAKKHVQAIKILPSVVEKEREDINNLTDEKVAHLIKSYKKAIGLKEDN